MFLNGGLNDQPKALKYMTKRLLTRCTLTGAMALALAACNAGGEEDGPTGVISSGVLNAELPTDAERAALPDDVNALIDSFITANETLVSPSALPSGTATYTGTSAFALIDGDTDAVTATLVGDASLSVDFDAAGIAVLGRFGNFVATDLAEGNTVTVNSGQIDLGNGVITGTEFAGGVAGSINATVSGPGGSETVNLSIGGDLDGAFAGADAGTAIGTVSGTADDGSGGTDFFDGLFVTERVVP